ncbi:FxsA family protein [Chryseomicrobium palamuruense]|uniref:FxsA family protein n=1 Tax=Chryseomicrobium palamuruense TaxID=682973 RepID=A0ABV8UX57_9BACL
MKYLIAAAIFLPIIEMILFVTIGKAIGVFWTIGLIFLSGIVGLYVVKTVGIQAFKELPRQMERGEHPANTVVDGVLLGIGAILVILPGFFTDLFGLSLLFAPTRKLYRPFINRFIQKKIRKGNIIIVR